MENYLDQKNCQHLFKKLPYDVYITESPEAQSVNLVVPHVVSQKIHSSRVCLTLANMHSQIFWTHFSNFWIFAINKNMSSELFPKARKKHANGCEVCGKVI